MSFGFSIADGFTLIQLAWSTYDGAKRACSEHDDLTREINSLCTVLGDLQSEAENSESLIHQAKGNRRKELENHMEGCERQLRRINAILIKFNSLSEDERSGTQLWQRVRFGNGPVKDVLEIRRKISTYTTAISMSLHLISQGSQGRMERMIDRQGGEITGLRESINLLLAKRSSTCEGSVFTDYSQDDIAWWRTFRHDLAKSGYKSRAIARHRDLIQSYVKELGDKGVFDDGINRSRLSLDSYLSAGEVAEVVELPVTTAPLIKKNYAEIETFKYHNPGPVISEMTQRIGHLEKQLKQAMNRGNERARGSYESDCSQLSDTTSLEAEEDHRPVSPMTDTEVENIPPPSSETSKIIVAELSSMAEEDHTPVSLMTDAEIVEKAPQPPEILPLSAVEFLAMADRDFVPEGEDQLDKEDLVKARMEAFSALSTEEKKKIITLQDPSEKKYSFPYYLVTKWHGIKHLVEQAFLNSEGLGEQVMKGEYDLINSDGAVIIPQLWETFVEPDLAITMDIWPTRELSTPTSPFQEVILRDQSPPRRSSTRLESRTSFQEVILRDHSPPRRSSTRPASRTSSCASSQKSGPKSSFKSISNSSMTSNPKSSSNSRAKPRSFWGFIQHPKPKKRTRSLPTRPPPPAPGWWLYPPYSPPPPPPPRPPLYTYSIPLPTKGYKDTKISEPKPNPPPPPPRSPLYADSILLSTKRYKETKLIELKPNLSEVTGIVYPTINEEGAPIFELE